MRDDLIHNERAKLTAAWLNTMASAAMTVGVLAPLATALYGISPSPVPQSVLTLGSWFGFPSEWAYISGLGSF
jgi:hypothetical protein